MPKLPIVNSKKVVKALLKRGFYIHHQSGSHARLINKFNSQIKVTVPIHNKDLPKGTLANIIRQSGLTIEEFISLL